jgi:CubicO group peptidase (beta-lactamase class C family)
MKWEICLLAGLLLAISPRAAALPPLSGRPVPELDWLDVQLQVYMESRDLQSGVVGIMRNGTIIYLRGCGWLNASTPLPETAIFRLASCTKPITAAAIRHLIRNGAFAVDDQVFSVGNDVGLLDAGYRAWDRSGDARFTNITVDHLLRHYGGWDRDIAGDLTRMEQDIADDMGIPSPPGRTNTLRWILGQPLEFSPGVRYAYSNIGYLALGLLLTERAPAGHMDYLHNQVLTPSMWVPATEVVRAHTFDADNDPREPRYQSDLAACVFDGGCEDFPPREAYGGVDMEARIGQGGIAASALAMLNLARHYRISPGTGQRIADAPLTDSESHNGALPGVNTLLRHSTQGSSGDLCIFIAFSKDAGEGHYASDFFSQIENNLIVQDHPWPTKRCDGFWIVPNAGVMPGHGSYTYPFPNMTSALAATTEGSRLRLKPGTSSWTGTLNKRLHLDAPLGAVTVGVD